MSNKHVRPHDRHQKRERNIVAEYEEDQIRNESYQKLSDPEDEPRRRGRSHRGSHRKPRRKQEYARTVISMPSSRAQDLEKFSFQTAIRGPRLSVRSPSGRGLNFCKFFFSLSFLADSKVKKKIEK